MKLLRIVLIGILTGMLTINPAFSNNRRAKEMELRSVYNFYGNMNYKQILLQGLKEAKMKKDRDLIKKALRVIEKKPEIGNIKATSAINNMSFFFLNHLEKDFIGHPNTFEFYQGFRSIFRGNSISRYNKKCVYRMSRGKAFTLIDFLDGKINCGRPKGYPRKLTKYEIIRQIENSITTLKKVAMTENQEIYSLGKKVAQGFLNLLIPNSYAVTYDELTAQRDKLKSLKKKRKGKKYKFVGPAMAIGAMLIVGGFFFSPVAGIGIPMIVIGVGLVGTSIGLYISQKGLNKKIKKEKQIYEKMVEEYEKE